MPPITKPVSSFASRALARRMSAWPVTVASRARSTRFTPDTRHRMGSVEPSGPGATNTSDFTIWPSSAPSARAASSAVCVASSKVVTSSVTAMAAAASTTRRIAGCSDGWGIAGSLATPGSTAVIRSAAIASPTMDAIVFDWDGTLIDSLAPLYAANVAVLASFGITLERDDYLAAYRPAWRAVYRPFGVP